MKTICPKCGREGNLREYYTQYRWYNWYVYHRKGERCTVLLGALMSLHHYKMVATEGGLEQTLTHIPSRWHSTFKTLFEGNNKNC